MLSLPVFDDQTQFFVVGVHGQFGSATGNVRVAKEEVEAVSAVFDLSPKIWSHKSIT